MEINNNLSEKAKIDLALIEEAKQGNQAAYAKLMEKYKSTVYFMMLKMVKNDEDAEDLTIEAFGKAFNSIHNYQPKYAFSTWLFKIASNNGIDFIRKKKVYFSSLDDQVKNEDGISFSVEVASNSLDPEESIMKSQKIKLMREVVKQLKPRYQTLIEKRYFQELTYEEIAEELDLPLGTVKAQLFRAREFLADIMKNSKDSI